MELTLGKKCSSKYLEILSGDLMILPSTKREEGLSLLFSFFAGAEISKQIAVHIVGAEFFPRFPFPFPYETGHFLVENSEIVDLKPSS
jgi:hypothetical protein